MGRQKNLIVLAILVLTVAGLGAQGTATLVRQRQGVHLAETLRPGPGDTKIVGRIIDVRRMPVAHVQVQLRNLTSGNVEQESESDENGEYSFIVKDPDTYIVEMVFLDGYVLALSNAAALARFETYQTMVQLPGRWEGMSRGMVMEQNVSNFIGMSAATTMTAQTMQIALEQSIQPVDSGEPVSPHKP